MIPSDRCIRVAPTACQPVQPTWPVNVVLFILWIVFADVLSAISGSC